ncbi:MAG: hypothetical protein H8E43_09945 [Planctomycetia bacterium]|nr:hypothetical protein [Planctomycetia bacterium]MBL6913924.1 hypothetical protein [Planctomycetota bacterium]HCW45520.1 hypothetical protein [Planctomycetota bacterium]
MKDDDLQSNQNESSGDTGAKSSTPERDLPEVEALPIDDAAAVSGLGEEFNDDDVIVYLDDVAEISSDVSDSDLLSHRPGEEDVLTEFERLPEVQVQLVEGLPEVFDVEEITDLVTEEVEGNWTDIFSDREALFDRCKTVVLENQKIFASVAAVFVIAAVALWMPGEASSESALVNPNSVVSSAESFDHWVGGVISDHLTEIGGE